MHGLESSALEVIAVLFYVSTGISAVLILGVLVFCLQFRSKTPAQVMLSLKEPSVTALLGVLLWLEVGAVTFYGWNFPEQMMNSPNAAMNTTVFQLAGAIAGGVAILYTVVKCIILTKDGKIIAINLFGQRREMHWNDIVDVQKTPGNRIRFHLAQGKSIAIGGDKKQLQAFLAIAAKQLPKQEQRDLVLKSISKKKS